MSPLALSALIIVLALVAGFGSAFALGPLARLARRLWWRLRGRWWPRKAASVPAPRDDWPDADLWRDFESSDAERRCYFYPARQCHGCTTICERLETAIPHGGPADIHPASSVAVQGAGAIRYFAARTHNHMPGQRCPMRSCTWPRSEQP